MIIEDARGFTIYYRIIDIIKKKMFQFFKISEMNGRHKYRFDRDSATIEKIQKMLKLADIPCT